MAAGEVELTVNSSCMTDCWTQAYNSYENYDWVRRTCSAAGARDEILTPVRSTRRSGTDRIGPSGLRPLFIRLPLYEGQLAMINTADMMTLHNFAVSWQHRFITLSSVIYCTHQLIALLYNIASQSGRPRQPRTLLKIWHYLIYRLCYTLELSLETATSVPKMYTVMWP